MPGGQGALLAVPTPTTIQKKARAEIKAAEPEISRVAQQTAELAQLARPTSGSNVAPIRITDLLSAQRKDRPRARRGASAMRTAGHQLGLPDGARGFDIHNDPELDINEIVVRIGEERRTLHRASPLCSGV